MYYSDCSPLLLLSVCLSRALSLPLSLSHTHTLSLSLSPLSLFLSLSLSLLPPPPLALSPSLSCARIHATDLFLYFVLFEPLSLVAFFLRALLSSSFGYVGWMRLCCACLTVRLCLFCCRMPARRERHAAAPRGAFWGRASSGNAALLGKRVQRTKDALRDPLACANDKGTAAWPSSMCERQPST